VATFAELAAQPYGHKGIGLLLSFYNYTTDDTWSFNVATDPVFAPGYSPILQTCSNVSFELSFLSPLRP